MTDAARRAAADVVAALSNPQRTVDQRVQLLIAFATEAVRAERERCAKIVEAWPLDGLIPATSQAQHEDIAAALREGT